MSAHLTSKRRGLKIGTALATGIIGIMQVPAAQAQTLPSIGTGNNGGAVITTIQTVNPGDTRQVDINGASRDINWQTYSIGTGGYVNYVNTGAAGNYVALNRVTGGNLSQIDGTINAPSSITVWLINPSGIMFSDGSTFSGGSLVLSTLTPRDTASGNGPADATNDIFNILDGVGAVELGLANGASTDLTGKITIEGATIGSSGYVALVSQQIEMNGTITADGDVGLILAQGITRPDGVLSPLSYTLAAGTKLNGNPGGEATAQLLVNGSITGANVKLYAVSEDDVTGALLRVNSGTLSASADGGVVSLIAEDTNGNTANILANGAITANNVNGSVIITADRNADIGGALTAIGTGNVTITATGDATVSGDVTMTGTGNYSVTGANVVLGGDGNVAQSTDGTIAITSTAGNITSNADVSLSSGGDTTITANDDAFLHSAMSIGGAYTVTADAVTFGDGTAKLQQAAGNISVTTDVADLVIASKMSLSSTGGTVGLTTTSGDVIIRGNARSDGDLTVTSSDNVKFATFDLANSNGFLRSTNGNLLIDAGESVIGDAGTAGDVPTALRGIYGYDVTGDLTVNVAGDLTVSQLKAGGSLALTIGGALAGAPDGALPALGSGALYATTGSVTVKANANSSSVVLNEVQSATGTTIWGDDVAIGTVKQGATTLTLRNHDDSAALTSANYYIGLLSKTGDLTVTEGNSGVAATVVASSAAALFDPDFGKANLTATTGSITGTITDGAQLGTVNAGTLINLTAGGIVADSATAATTASLTATSGTLAVGTASSDGDLTLTKNNGSTGTQGDELRLGTGTVTTGGATLTSKTSVRVASLTAEGAVSLTATDGDISGSLTGTEGSLALISTGSKLDSNYGSANLISNTASVSATALAGGAQIGNVTADTDFTVDAKSISVTTAGVGNTADLTASQGTLVIGSVTSGLAANLTKSGGLITTAGDEIRILTGLLGGTSLVSAGTQVTSSTHARFATVRDYASSVTIGATSGDIVVNNQVLAVGGIVMNAGRDVQIAAYNSTTNDGRIRSFGGGIDITAGRSVYGIGGSDSSLGVTPGVGSEYVVSGNVLVQGVGDLLVGSITAGGAISFDLTGGIYGTTGSSGANIASGALFATNNINVTAQGASGVNVLNLVNSSTGVANLSGDQIAIGTPDASGTFYYDETGTPYNLALPADAAKVYIGVISITGDYVLAPNNPLTYTNLIATEADGKFETTLGKANLDAGSTISGTISGAAQLGNVLSGDAMTLTAGALVADTITVNVDSLDVTATTGTLSILDASVSGTLTLTKEGGSVLTEGDDLRLLTASTGGSIDLTSSTSIRAGSLNAAGASINLTATNGDISGMLTGTWEALPTISSSTILSTEFDAADLVSAGSITATANNGSIQLGTVEANDSITADAKAFVADSLTAHLAATGLVDVTVTSGSLNVGSVLANSTTLTKTGSNGAIRFASINGSAVTLNSSTDVIGTSIGAIGLVDIDASQDIDIDTIGGGSVNALAQRDATFQTVTASGSAYLGAVRDLSLDALTSTTSTAVAEAGRNITVTTKVDGKTAASAHAGILDNAGLLDAVLITSDGTASALSGGDATVTDLTGDGGASVQVVGDYSGTAITSTGGAISFSNGGDVAVNTVSGQTGISGTVGSLHAISLTSAAGGVTLTASSGDIAGKLSGTPGALPTTTSGTALSSDYGKLNVTALGAVSLTANSGAMQLGTVTNGGDFTGSAKAITIDSATPGGLLSLTATSGTLYVGSAESGLSLTLDKQGTDDELRFGTLESGGLAGGTSGSATLTSSTDIRGTSITARGGSISATAGTGEVTGLSGGRLALNALPDLDGLGDPVAGTDTGTITVTSGLLSRLGNLRAGSKIAVTAGVNGSATLGGAIDVLDVTSATGSIDLTTYNDGIANNGISYQDLSGQRIWVFAYGTASGDIDGLTASGTNLYTYAESGGVTVTDHTGTGYVYVVAGGGNASAGVIDAGSDVAYISASNDAQATSMNSDLAVYMVANNDVDVGTATSSGFIYGNAGNDLLVGTLTSTGSYVDLVAGGDITATGDIGAQTNFSAVADGSVSLGSVTATTGNITVQAGTLTGDGSIDIDSAKAAGSIQLVATATGTADDGTHDGTVRVGTAEAGTTLTLSNVLLGGTIGDVIVDTSATAGFGALPAATGNDARFDAAENARIESATALTGTIAVRAGDAIGAANLAQGADLNAGEDLALKAGSGINLGTATAGDDLILESTNTITVGDLTATGSNAALDNRTVSFASPTTIAIGGPETNLGASIVVRSSTGSVNSNGDLTANNGSVTIDAADEASVTGNVVAGINYTVTAVNDITLGGASDASQSAKGAVLIQSTSGGVLAEGAGALTLKANSDGLGTETLTITAPQDITIGSATLIGGDGGKQSDVLLTSTNGEISLTGIDAARLIASAVTGFTATAAISVGSAATGADPAAGPSTVDIKVSAGNILADDITAAGAGHDIRLAASGTITTGNLIAARSVIVNGGTVGSASGAFSADSLTSQAGPIDIKASTITVTGATGSAGALTLETTGGNLALGDASSNGVMSLTSSGALTAASLTSTGGGITGTGASVSISGAVTSGGPLALTSSAGDLTIGSGSAAGTASLTASGKITTGALSAGGNAVTLTAADADITGTVSGSTIAVINKATGGNTFRIGDNAEGTGGFALDAAEVNRLSAATVTLDAGTGTGLTAQDVQIGDLDLTNATLQTLEVYGMQRIDITGALTKGAGSGLTSLRLGGTAADTDLAAVLRLAAQGDGSGGLIDVDTAALELRAAKIGAGQDAGFLDLVGIGANPVGTPLDARLMVSNPASSLYNATALGGTIYQPAAQVMIKANTMVVRYSDFALFQNTGLPGANEGVRLASATSPIAPALRIIGPASPVGGPFAMFGEINGVRDTATALLGDAVINVLSVDRTSARINGCLIGSGAGCLTTLAISPILGTFDPVRGSIFFANADFELPFDPLVGTNNDSLFGDVGTFGLEDVPLESIECTDDKAGAQCAKPNGEQK